MTDVSDDVIELRDLRVSAFCGVLPEETARRQPFAFDLDVPMGLSTCVSCGECAAACPTGALVDKAIGQPLRPRTELERVDTVCPYCGVGCTLSYHVDPEANAIVFAEGRESPAGATESTCKHRTVAGL